MQDQDDAYSGSGLWLLYRVYMCILLALQEADMDISPPRFLYPRIIACLSVHLSPDRPSSHSAIVWGTSFGLSSICTFACTAALSVIYVVSTRL